MLFIVYAESANYAGYGQRFVVEASNTFEAEDLAQIAANDYFLEQDRDQLEEEGVDLDDVLFSTIETVEKFDENHECWQFYLDPSQEEFYYKVNL